MKTFTRNPRCCGVSLLLAVFALAGQLAAQGIAPVDRGFYDDSGAASSTYSYLTGKCPVCPALEYRSWFVFDLSCVPDTITSASLSIELPLNGYKSSDLTESFELFDVATAPLVLMSGAGGLSTYTDLGTGTSLASAVISADDEGMAISIPLNASGLAWLNANLGGLVALGGALTSLDGDPGKEERIFGGGSADWAVRLITTPSCKVRDADDRGWYDDTGTHVPTNQNYILGNCSSCGGGTYRNFFVFSLGGLGGLVTGATLALEHPYGHGSPDPFETYSLVEVSTSHDSLVDGVGGTAAYDDLGGGTEYASYDLTIANSNSLVSIPLAGAGLVALNESMGGQWVLGGSITTLDGDPSTNEVSFGAGSPGHGITQMLFDVEPAWAWLGGGTEGALGQPLLLGYGPLTAGSQASVSLSNAPPGALMLAWISFAGAPFAALGGTVHAFPTANQLLFSADGGGAFSGGTAWPAGVPSGTQVWFQFIVQDLSSIHGLTLSNGLLATAP